jgi:L-alanine-DL-glutamate epimerase-like enolase superfamily enzyme
MPHDAQRIPHREPLEIITGVDIIDLQVPRGDGHMQITKVEVTPIDLQLTKPVRTAGSPEIRSISAVFVRFQTQGGLSAWGCTVVNPELTGEEKEKVLKVCHKCADIVPDLHPTNIEFSLAGLTPLVEEAPTALCAFDLAFHDLLGKQTGLPLYRLLGGYRARIPTSITLPIAPVKETLDMAQARAGAGFRILKIKGGEDPEEDVKRVHALRQSLPHLILRLDVDGGYSIRDAISVAAALEGEIEMLEQPTPPEDLVALGEVTRRSPVPILADQSVRAPASALSIASRHLADGMCVKISCCGGLLPARQIESIARAAQIRTMISCAVEPALLIAAGLGLALSSPNVRYADLDGHLTLADDPGAPTFHIEDGELYAPERPGLGCEVDLG